MSHASYIIEPSDAPNPRILARQRDGTYLAIAVVIDPHTDNYIECEGLVAVGNDR